jgi:single-strand DNA-binding protein
MRNLRNSVSLIGNLGNEPIIKKFKNGTQKAILILATDESYTKKNGERVKSVQWHKLVITNSLVDVVEKYVQKGMRISINGRLRCKSWETKDGQKQYRTEIEVNDLLMLGKMIA